MGWNIFTEDLGMRGLEQNSLVCVGTPQGTGKAGLCLPPTSDSMASPVNPVLQQPEKSVIWDHSGCSAGLQQAKQDWGPFS